MTQPINVPPSRAQMILMALSDKNSFLSSSFELYNSYGNQAFYYPVMIGDDKSYAYGEDAFFSYSLPFEKAEKIHMKEVKAFTPNGLLPSDVAKEIFFPVFMKKEDGFDLSYSYSTREFYKKTPIIDINKDNNFFNEEEVEKYIEEQISALEPSGKPITYFDEYSILIIEDAFDINGNKYERYYATNINNLVNYNIRLNEIEITNNAKDQFTVKNNFDIKMELNFSSMNDIDYVKIATNFDMTEEQLIDLNGQGKPNYNPDGAYTYYGSTFTIRDIIMNEQNFGIKIRTYFDEEFYPKLGSLLKQTPIEIKSETEVEFNFYDSQDIIDKIQNIDQIVSNELTGQKQKKISDIYNELNYKKKTKNYYYIDKILKIQFKSHNYKFYANKDSYGNTMDLPHKLTMEFAAWIDVDVDENRSIYGSIAEEFVQKSRDSRIYYERQVHTAIAKCEKEIKELNETDSDKRKAKIADIKREAKENVSNIKQKQVQDVSKIQSLTNYDLIKEILTNLTYYSVKIPGDLFGIIQYQNAYDGIIESLGLRDNWFSNDTTVGEFLFGNDAEIQDLSWINLLENINTIDLDVEKDAFIPFISKEAYLNPALVDYSNIYNLPAQVAFSRKDSTQYQEDLKKELDSYREDVIGDKIDTNNVGIVTFVYLGDIINYVLKEQMISKGKISYDRNKDGVLVKSSIVDEKYDNNIFLTGNYLFKNYLKNSLYYNQVGKETLINLMSVPISVNLLVDYLKDKLLSRNNMNYPYMQFLKELINELVKGTMQKAWMGENSDPKKIKELKKFIPYNVNITRIPMYGTKNEFIDFNKDSLKKNKKLIDVIGENDGRKKFYPDTKFILNEEHIQENSNYIITNSKHGKKRNKYNINYFMCSGEHTYIDFYKDFESKTDINKNGYNSLSFMEQVIENFQTPCILLTRSNVIPQIMNSNGIDLSRIDNANQVVGNVIAGQNLLKNFSYQGTIPLHSMFAHFIDIGNYIFISPGSFGNKKTTFSGLYIVLKSTYKKKFSIDNTPAEYTVEVRQESTGVVNNMAVEKEERKKSKSEVCDLESFKEEIKQPDQK